MLVAEVVTMVTRTADLSGDATDNTVRLQGRVSSAPVERELPSGASHHDLPALGPRARTPDDVRAPARARTGSTAWPGRAKTRRSVGGWTVGDQVEVTGALRRRFYRAGEAASTRLEVEVLGARRARARERPRE